MNMSSLCQKIARWPWVSHMTFTRFYLLICPEIQEISPEYSLEGPILKLKLQYFGYLMWRTDSLEKTLMLERLKAGEEGDDRGWDGWMASPTRWTWVWVSFRNWWWTRKPGVLQSVGSQRVGHDWATELNWLTSSVGQVCLLHREYESWKIIVLRIQPSRVYHLCPDSEDSEGLQDVLRQLTEWDRSQKHTSHSRRAWAGRLGVHKHSTASCGCQSQQTSLISSYTEHVQFRCCEPMSQPSKSHSLVPK